MIDRIIEKEIDGIFESYDKIDSPGCALGIVQAGEPVYLRGFGTADLETGAPITPDTVFHLASVSKQFTAACIALLEEAGEISLQDPVKKYLPFLPDYGHELHLGHLVYMTNGLEDFYDITSFIMGIPEGNYFSAQEAVRIIGAANWLKFRPGEQWSYGNTGYFLLASIIEKVSGQSFDGFVRENVFEPLGMMNTFIRTNRFMDIPGRARGYARIPLENAGDASSPAFTFQLQNELIEFGGAGQAWSSLNDLVKWEANFYDNRLGGKDSSLIEKMSRPGQLNDGTPTCYAYGQFIGQRNGLKVIFHEGGAAGVNTVIYRVPEKKLSIICLANTSDFLTALLRKLGEECYERATGIVLGWEQEEEKPSEVRKEKKASKPVTGQNPSSAELECLTGSYEDPGSSYIWEIRLEGAKVKVLENFSKRFSLDMKEACGDDQITFQSNEPALNGVFRRSESGIFKEIVVRQEDLTRTFQRFLEAPPSSSHLEEYEGLYTCHSLDTSYRVWAATNGIRLENLNPENDLLNVVFTPTVKDMFLARYPPRIGWYVIHFKRDAGGCVVSFSFRDEVPGRERWVFEKEG